MSTDLERLKSWMQTNGYSPKRLWQALAYSDDWVSNVLSGKVAISHSFKERFGRAFGRQALDVVFQDHPVPQSLESYGNWQEHGKAHAAVWKAIKDRQMPHPTKLKCMGCEKQAQLYHHESYAPTDRLTVVPLCRSCHRQHHSGRKQLTFGVVPTSIGLVRIAIALAGGHAAPSIL